MFAFREGALSVERVDDVVTFLLTNERLLFGGVGTEENPGDEPEDGETALDVEDLLPAELTSYDAGYQHAYLWMKLRSLVLFVLC